MPETPSDSIWIVTEDKPHISIPDGSKGVTFRGGGWGDEARETTGTKATWRFQTPSRKIRKRSHCSKSSGNV
ncbi:hypothetical protein HCG51_02760 [Tolypothrix sp. PCC 7910]|uniref:hypothetical protein n=1 Tax=Tolypothrix sp. PCC 7910 TaxID=2099387 RepID=UPI0014279D45|nr:hypothetical protein [Tolypothrix sp. PCC 7910]QIR35777.1 hypothetical protein HCG51_02760 [Tolypothrix sp. PCC 7910]